MGTGRMKRQFVPESITISYGSFSHGVQPEKNTFKVEIKCLSVPGFVCVESKVTG